MKSICTIPCHQYHIFLLTTPHKFLPPWTWFWDTQICCCCSDGLQCELHWSQMAREGSGMMGWRLLVRNAFIFVSFLVEMQVREAETRCSWQVKYWENDNSMLFMDCGMHWECMSSGHFRHWKNSLDWYKIWSSTKTCALPPWFVWSIWREKYIYR